jgi:putative peptidoglycan lipid II flippase
LSTQDEHQQENGSEEEEPESGAAMVAGGILSSRVMGLIREGATSYFFGVGAFMDVFQTAIKTPNLLQNLLGEGTISAAFIPIYSRMIEEGREEEAGRFAGAIFGLLLAVAGGVALLGVAFADPIVSVLAPGFLDDAEKVRAGEMAINRFNLTVQTVRIIFLMAGILVLSAWALGILNSHRRFFLPYVAPVLWNASIITGLFGTAYWFLPIDPLGVEQQALGNSMMTQLLFAACFGALAGGVLQFAVQVPLVLKLSRKLRLSISTKVEGVQEAISAFWPVVAGRGVYQISAYLDQFFASFLAAGAIGAQRFALILYTLPISLFGLSVAAAELPELSRIEDEDLEPFLERIDRSVRQVLFMLVPTIVGYVVFGFLVVGLLFQQGKFGASDTWLTYAILFGYALGLMATALSRLLQNSFYALGDTKTPAKIAVLRIALSAAVGVPVMFWLDQFAVGRTVARLGLPVGTGAQTLYLGAVGLALGASAGGWIELVALVRSLRSKLGRFPLPWSALPRLFGLALVSVGPGLLLWWTLPAAWGVKVVALVVLAAYALTYLGGAFLLGFSEIEAWAGRFLNRLF